MKCTCRAPAICLLLLVLAAPAFAQFSGFLENYPPLEPLDGVANLLVWKASDVEAPYGAIYFDPPELFLDPNSEYRGFQPDVVRALSDTLLEILQTSASEMGHEVVEEPGPNVLRVRTALTNVYLKRRSEPYRYSFRYQGFRLRAAMGGDISLVEATMEAELLDGESLRRLGFVIAQVGQRRVRELDVPESITSWSNLVTTLNRVGRAANGHFAELLAEQR